MKKATSLFLALFSLIFLTDAGWLPLAKIASGGGGTVTIVDAGTNVGTGGDNSPSATYTRTVTASATLMVCSLLVESVGVAITGVNWDQTGTPQAMTPVTGAKGGTNSDLELWFVKNPNPVTGTLQVTWTGGTGRSSWSCITYSGNDTTTPLQNGTTTQVNNVNATIAITSATNDMVIAAFFDDGTAAASASCTPDHTSVYNNSSGRANCANTAAGAGSVTLGATFTGLNAPGFTAVGADIKHN